MFENDYQFKIFIRNLEKESNVISYINWMK